MTRMSNPPRTLRNCWIAVAALLLYAVASLAAAESGKLKNEARFEIAPQTLSSAVIRFSEQSGVQIVTSDTRVSGLKTKGVKGTLSVRDALRQLLEGTGLTFKSVGETAIALVSAGQATASAATALQLARNDAPSTEAGTTGSRQRASEATEVVVTGTRDTGVVNQGVIPRQENEAVRYNIISREDIERMGVTTMPELMRRVTANQEAGTTSQRAFAITVAATGNILGSGDQINLRGLGNSQTLVMINGRKVYGSDNRLGPDISRIPLSAVERIEILPSSGSAIYGANSVAGVVNIIMRQDYQGTEVSSYFGSGADGGAEEYRFDLFHGRVFNQGRTNMTVGVSLQRFGDLLRSDRGYDERLLRSPGAAPGTAAYSSLVLPMLLSRQGVIVTSSPLGLGIPSDPAASYAAIPAGSDGIGLTPQSFVGTAGQAFPSTERTGRNGLRQESKNHAIMVNLDHAILGETLGFYSELTWREDETPIYYPAGNVSVRLSAGDPRNPFRTDVTPGFVGRDITLYRDPADLPDSYQNSRRQTLRAVAGLKGTWRTAGGGVFNWAADGSWDRNQTDTELTDTTFGFNVASQSGLYNVLRDLTGLGLVSKAEAEKHSYTYASLVRPTIAAANLRLNGDLFAMWGGAAKFSVGSEFRREQYYAASVYKRIGEYFFLPGGSGPLLTDRVVADTSRDVFGAYGEVVLPLVGPENRKPWLHSLDISAGIRYERYDDFQAAEPPLLAVKAGLTPDIALRASWAEGFQPPTVANLTDPLSVTTSSGGSYVDPLRPGVVNPNYTTYSSGNPGLQAETAETWDAGIILTPRALPGLTLNASYFRYDKRGNVSSLSLTQAIESFPELVVRAAPSAEDIAAGRPGPVTEYYYKPVNIARQFTDGVDVNFRYTLPARSWGRVTLLSNGTWTKRFFTQARPGQPEVDALGLAGFAGNFTLEKRANATVIWSRGELSTSLTGNYTDSFEARSTTATARNPGGSGIDGDSIGGQWTLDLQLEYIMPEAGIQASGMREWLGGTRWTVGALNVFDTMPDLWTDRYRAFVSPFVDARQRFVYLQLKKSFD